MSTQANKEKTIKKNAFVEREEAILDFWDQAEIFRQSVEKKAPQGNFVFYEGPPTANGRPGIHHVLARAFKDVIPRYKTMSGYRVERKAGWDTHGLPVELQVEKELDISGKADIEKYGVAEFNSRCQTSVWTYLEDWRQLTRRIAFWLDLDNPYVTYENNYMESLWWILKEINERQLLYKGHKVVPHCPRCGTALSSHEVAQGYKLVTDNTLYLKFKVKAGQGAILAGDYLLAWTTTPWTLPGNVALAVGEKLDYVRVKINDKQVILAKEQVSTVLAEQSYQVLAELKGSELVGLGYEPLFQVASLKEEAANKDLAIYQVFSADFVSTTEGTGIVHLAPMYGEDDYSLGLAHNLPKVHTVDEAGKFKASLADYKLAGLFVKSATAEQLIIDYLKEQQLIFSELEYRHDYPFCWRCDTPLLYYAKDSWFIATSKLKEELIANNQQINWVPSHIKEGRFGEWLNNVKDWAISRERYWGTPLPIWECATCQTFKVIGSREELAELSGVKINLQSDLHKPAIDELEITCTQCQGKMKRVKEVFDCWFDSGAMPLAQHHYPFEQAELIDKGEQFPADFICEAIDQTRGWFYTLLAVSTALGKGHPYRNVICLGHINDKTGKKMSKSRGNVITPDEVINLYGVDAIRQHLYTINQPGEGKRYDLDDVKDVFRKNIMLLENVYKFYELAVLEVDSSLKPQKSPAVLDQWILAKLAELITGLSQDLDNYHIYEAARRLPVFIDELSTWYVRRSRDRFKSEDEQDRQFAQATLHWVLLELAKVMAPFMPFMAENLWQRLSGHNFSNPKESVHLVDWPQAGAVDEEVLREMAIARQVVELGLAKRDEAGIKIRQKLSQIKVNLKAPLKEAYLELIKDELNIETVVVEISQAETMTVILDTEITPALRAEGWRREVVRAVNLFRKESGLTREDRTKLYFLNITADLKTMLSEKQAEIMKDTLSVSLEFAPPEAGQVLEKDIKINEETAKLLIVKE
ncbi:MAG: isoleucine--tRNA ligase [Patescibacteria group bacterium]|jgi:isoleucyl-tRNA synthetase